MMTRKPAEPFLTIRQVGLAAAFGAAGFAFRASGLVVQLPVSVIPSIDIDFGAFMPCLAGMAAGPIVRIIVGIARGIPSGLARASLVRNWLEMAFNGDCLVSLMPRIPLVKQICKHSKGGFCKARKSYRRAYICSNTFRGE